MVVSSRKGRRPGSPDTQGEILEAAREAFAGRGYERATIRGIARSAGVDPALVLHYFDSKEQLFIAALRVPVNPAAMVRQVLAVTPADEVGVALVTRLLTIWDDEANRSPLVAVLRSATGEGPVADTVREFVEQVMITAFAAALPGPEARLRGLLIGSQVAGLLFVRYVLALEPLASADPQRLAAIYGPTIQRYAHGPLPPGAT